MGIMGVFFFFSFTEIELLLLLLLLLLFLILGKKNKMNFHSGGWAKSYDEHDHTKSSTVMV